MFRLLKITVLVLVAMVSLQARADLDSDISHLQQRWAEVNYQLEGKTRLSEFEKLVAEAAVQDIELSYEDALARARPQSAEQA